MEVKSELAAIVARDGRWKEWLSKVMIGVEGDKMDKSWMTINNRLTSKEYQQGVKSFLDFATANLGVEDEIRCPCIDCINGTKYSRQVVWMHLIRRGMASSYLTWVHHGEHVPVSRPSVSNDQYGGSGECMTDIDDPPMDELPIMLEEIYVSGLMDDHTDEEPNGLEREDFHKFTRLFKDAQRKVYRTCEKFSVLSFVIKMLHVKVYNKWSNKSFDMVMQVFKDILPECDPTVPWTLYDAKKFLCDLGLGYETIHSCKNDCALFWKESANLKKCPTCDACRYNLNDNGGKKIPHKVLRYFPLTPRLKRLYMSKKTAANMRWHNEKHVDDDILRHPADGEAWKDFDKQHPTFSDDSRNCMKEPYCMMSLLIPGRSAPGRDIDVYLQPLIEELKNLWEHGLQTYDASNGQIFRMHAAVMWTINDFPAYGNMSGWSTKGYLACPNCNNNASSQGLRSKIGYIGACRHLPENHTWRTSKLFNGQTEHRSKPLDLSGDQILKQIDSGTYKPYGKHLQNRKRQRNEHQNLNWSKRSIMFDLLYWKTLKLRHNLDVMHIEKNICDNVVGTLLSVDGKNKNTDKARLDLEDMKIGKELHLKRRSNGSFEKPPAFITLSLACKIRLLGRLKGFVANKAHPEGSIAEAYIFKECTTFCSMYLDGVETLFNRPERNYDVGDRGPGLAVFTQTVRPFGLMTRASDVSVAERELAHWEHKNWLHQRAGAFDIENRHRKEFPKWFKDHMNELRSQVSPEVTDDMWSLANGPSGLVNTYSGCICNGVRYHTIDRNNRRKSQNSGLVVEGEHEG
ncbi:uncharacterized protein LOC114288392 [Camellia sinensis]|uniref:uncharacterized protein LOC114288392 n=1 Tax=Camellia sinensis TaxID=4442 RepID=UPI00103634FE|nr:uncharacterized protein LOC114288392 [Camellia sinensis]